MGFPSNEKSISSRTRPEFQNWNPWRMRNSSAVKEVGSLSVIRWVRLPDCTSIYQSLGVLQGQPDTGLAIKELKVY